MKLTELKGIGTKTENLFNRINIYNSADLIRHYPRNYDIYEEPVTVHDVTDERIYALELAICGTPSIVSVRNLQIITVTGVDRNGEPAQLKWFNMPFLRTKLKTGCRFIFRGKVSFGKTMLMMEQPVIYTYAEYAPKLKTMQPLYPLTAGLTNNMVTKVMQQCLLLESNFEEYLPSKIIDNNDLCDIKTAVKNIHFPSNMEDMQRARKRLVFDEFFLFSLGVKRLKKSSLNLLNSHIINNSSECDRFINELPYSLTGAQKKVWEEIKTDMSGNHVMSRLVQGDVGSGKTVIAELAMINTALAGHQAVLMAPTEVLARQHYENITSDMEKAGIKLNIFYLAGSTPAKEKKVVYEYANNGHADIIIGTHALIQDKLEFHDLALVITDEQHRFGVAQRNALSMKGDHPHVLVMSATPIPRSLAVILYGDLDISVIDELPGNRIPIKNCVVDDSYREKAYKFIQDEVDRGHQIFIICPMVEESENSESENVIDYTSKIKSKMSGRTVIKYLHGRMKNDEKNEIMTSFAKGETDILVSTTVIEVGINVPNATVMMVENAEKFGLAQLHQLRGRVGRGGLQSYCIFMSNTRNEESKERLKILKDSNDGFYIASEDLKMRGPGDLFGIRQSGDMNFRLGDIYQDAAILKEAAKSADELIRCPELISSALEVKVEEYMNNEGTDQVVL